MKSGCSVVTNTATRHSGMPASTMRRHSSVRTLSERCSDLAPSASQSTTLRMSFIGDGRGLLRLDPGELDHLGPFLDVFLDELLELGRRIRRHRNGAKICEPLLDGRIEHGGVGLLVEHGDHLGWRAPRRAEADPARRLVAFDVAV